MHIFADRKSREGVSSFLHRPIAWTLLAAVALGLCLTQGAQDQAQGASERHAAEPLDVSFEPACPIFAPRETVRLAAGDVLVLFTDGVSEAMNPHEEEWGEERLQCLGRECERCAAQETLGRIVDAVRAHSTGTTQSDDITLLVARFTE